MGGVCLCVCVCMYVCVCVSGCAEHPPLTCTQLESALYCPDRMEMKSPLYCASELMGSWLHPMLLGAPKKPRTPYHTGGLMLAFADPRREPTLPLRSTQFLTAQKEPPTIQQDKARVLGPSTREQGSQECGNLGSLTA